MITNDDGGLLTTPEAAQYVRKSAETLKWLRWHGTGPAYYRVGRSVLYRRRDLDEWVEQGRVATKTPAGAA